MLTNDNNLPLDLIFFKRGEGGGVARMKFVNQKQAEQEFCKIKQTHPIGIVDVKVDVL